MGRKLNLSHLSEEECEKILHVLQKDFEVRQAEKERIGVIQKEVKTEQSKAQVLSQKIQFNKNCCIRCYQVFGLIFNRRRQCFHCGYNVCKNCSDYHPDTKVYICHTCEKERDLTKQSCDWFYSSVGQKFRRFGSAKVVRSLYKSSSYSDTELDRGYGGDYHSVSVTSRRNTRPPLPEEFRRRSDHDEDDDNDDDDDDGENSDELASPLPKSPSRPQSTSTAHSLGSSPANRAGSLDTLNLLATSSSSSSKRHKTRTADPSRSLRASNLGKSRTPDPGGARARWEDVGGSGGRIKKETKDDIYKQAFESARQAEEHKFKAKFDVMLTDLHQTLDRQSPQGLTDSFASTSYGEVMLSFRGRVKDLLVGFSQRLQLAYESFDSVDSQEDHGQSVRQNVSRLLEDLLGESLDLTSDEAVSDLSSLSDDSGNDRHAYEDQLAQAVVSKILDSHRREVHHSLHEERRSRHLSPSLLVPEALNDDDEDDVNENSSTANKATVKDTDISKDFEDLRNFVQTTQSRSWQLDENCPAEDSEGGVGGEGGVLKGGGGGGVGSSFDTHSTDRDFPPLPDFSQFEQIDFNSGEIDPDLLQMNLDVIPEETQEQLLEEVEAADTHWRENWIFKGQAPALHSPGDRKRFRGDNDQPQYVMVPQPDEDLAPRIGNKDVHQLSDLSDNEELTDDDTSFYPQTSEELARISRHPRFTPSFPSLSSPSLLPALDPATEETDSGLLTKDSPQPHPPSSQVAEVREEAVSPPVEKTQPRELKLLEDLVPAEGGDPQFLALPESVTVQEGEPVKVFCRVSGTQPIDVFWYREQQEVEELEEGEEVEVAVEGDRHQVTLYNLSKEQAGQYMCIALSEAGKAIKYFTVTVKDNKQELKKPEFLKELKDTEVLEGQSVKFRCKVKGYPQPRVNWYKDGKLLRSSRSCRIEKFGNRDYILTVDYATMEDDAEYMVVASNVAGQVRSTAQVIVEPYAEGHPLLLKGRSLSMSTVFTDPDSERASVSFMDDLMSPSSLLSSDREEARLLSPEDTRMDSLVSKVSTARDDMRQEAEKMLDTADELSALSHHLEDVERHLDDLDGRSSYAPCVTNAYRARAAKHSRLSSLRDDAALALLAEEKATGEATRTIRKLTSNALSVLRAAEEIIQSEKSLSPHSSPPPQLQGASASSPLPDLPGDSHCRSLSLGSPVLDHSSLTGHPDLNQSVSSGYGTLSMTSSALEDTCPEDTCPEDTCPEDTLTECSQLDQDDFALCLPPLEDPTSGPLREEKAPVKVSSGGKPSGASSSSSSSTLTDSSGSSYASSGATVRPRKAASPLHSAAQDSLSDLMARAEPAPREAGARSLGKGEEEESLQVNFGPKEISRAAYCRDYVVAGGGEGEEGADRKRWSVSLDPYVPSADVVNRQPTVEETEEQIYLTAGKTFHLEERVRELEGRVCEGARRGPPSSLTRLEDQVANTAARVVRNEKEVTSIERAVHSLQQFSPRSSRGSSSSSCSTPRESIDSGVSSFMPERPADRPLPLHLTGHSQEAEVPESRAEFDTDSGVELPSVTRLRAMFGSRGNKEEGEGDWSEGSFKRVHSITARSLTKSQLQQLREAGNATLQDSAGVKVTTATLPMPAADDRSPGQRSKSPSSSPLASSHSQPAVKKIKTADLSEPALYRDLDPSKQPVLIYPEVEKTSPAAVAVAVAASSVRSLGTGPDSPQSAVPGISTEAPSPAALSAARPLSPTPAAVSESQGIVPNPKIRSGCISARAAFWERRIMQGEATDVDVEEEFPEMVKSGDA